MPTDFGTQVVTAAGTREPLTNDLSSGYVRASSNVTTIRVKAPANNAGLVYFGRDAVSATYGWTLAPGEALPPLGEINEKFGNFNVDAATSGDSVEWAVVFTSAQRKS